MADTLLDQLAPAYAAALLLEAAGLDAPQIGARLEIPVESVPTLLQVARAKLAAAAGASPEPETESPSSDR